MDLKKIAQIPEQSEEIAIRDKARNYLRYGLNEANKSSDDLVQIIKEQIEFLKATEDFPAAVKSLPDGQKPKDEP